jgi:uncharacterized membrane protein YeaQ/YmgE (transglycosylase-associated protein family)
MNLVIWLAVGASIGWVGSLVLKSDPEQGVFMNVVVGIVGALIGGWIVGPLVGAASGTRGAFSASGMLVSMLGAVLLLALFNLARARRLR